MTFNTIIRTSEHSPRNDESAVGAINRPLHCHLERREGPVALGRKMLRCAQHDNAAKPAVSPGVMLSAAKGLSRWAARCFAALSMTGLSPIRMPGLFFENV